MTYYPSCITDAQICNNCYASQSCTNCVDGSGSHPCSAYCNTGCNTICVTKQTFCALGVETVVNHADIQPKTLDMCTVKDEFIFRNWTADLWNKMIQAIDKAGALGVLKNQGTPPSATNAAADPENSPHPANSLVTAIKYNEQVKRINFFNKSLSTVVGVSDNGVGDVIRGSHSLALKNGYESMKFNQDVCDVCNVANQNRNDCNCSCPCSCACSCNCTCYCYCGCSSGGRS